MSDRREEDLRALLRGDSEVVNRARRWAFAVVSSGRLNIPWDEREDLVQETMISLLRSVSRPGFTLRSNLHALVRTIATARAIDWLRRRPPQQEFREDYPSSDMAPDRRLQIVNDLSRIEDLLTEASANQRQIITLRLRDELSFKEIARITGVREGTLRFRLHDSIKRLRRHLNGENDRKLGS